MNLQTVKIRNRKLEINFQELMKMPLVKINQDVSTLSKRLKTLTDPISIASVKDVIAILKSEINRRAEFIPTAKLMKDLNYFYQPNI